MLRRALRRIWNRSAVTLDGWDPWSPILAREAEAWRAAREAARGGPRVLIGTASGGFHVGALVESSLAAALTLRGAEVDVLLCDSALPACQLTEIASAPPRSLRRAPPQPRCRACESRGRAVFTPLGLKLHWIGSLTDAPARARAEDLTRSAPLDGLERFRLDGLAVGEHAVAGALRYFARGDFEGEPEAGPIARAYLRSALLTVAAMEGLLAREKHDIACFHHGIYVPQGLIGEVCRRRGVRVVNWNPAYRRSSFIFSHADTYHHTMLSEPSSDWEGLEWSEALARDLLAYLESRRRGTGDWIWFHDEPEEDSTKIARDVGCDFSKPTVTLLTSVQWDARLHYAASAFPDMRAWVLETIRWFAGRPDLQLVVRIHPAELRGGIPSRQLLEPDIRRAFPSLPRNVFIVPPGSQASTYALADCSNAVLIYNTKTGIEVSSRGIPVIVAGEAWIRGKGFTLDADSPGGYRRLLERLPLSTRLSPAEVLRARKYAYHFFFRRMIPLPFVEEPEKHRFRVTCKSLDDLRPGRCSGLDVICDGILAGKPFVYRAESFQEAR